MSKLQSTEFERLSELARPLFRPALDYDFLLSVELDSVAALRMLDAKEAVLPAAERKVSHRRRNSNVDADVPRRCFVTELAGRRAARRKNRSRITIRALRQKRYR